MEQQNEPLQKRARIAPAEVQPQAASPACAVPAQGSAVSSATGTTVAPVAAVVGPVKPAAAAAPASSNPAPSAGSANVTKPVPAPGAPAAAAAAKPAAATAKPPSFIADAREAVRFRALTCRDAEALQAEIAAGGAPVHVDFLHQHFGDSEQIRGYSNLKITIWFHVQTYHAWVDVSFATKRPGADKLSDIWEGAFPEGYCSSKEDFVEQVVRTAAALPDLLTLGQCVGTVPVRPSSAAGLYGLSAAPQQASAAVADAPAAAAPQTAQQQPLEVSVRRFQLLTAPPEVKALHARLEPLLLFTIDGANFIDGDDPQWELLLPVVRAPDGGCLVLGLTTLFNFWAYPASCRLRVSQVLVLSPWQGLGLGKALLKLSYDLAKSRGCADLTVEDPTPNLQRVREKLEVEMLRQLDWVVAQANKCLDAAARGETTWPAWSEPEPQQAEPSNAQEPAPAEQPAASVQLQQPGAQPQGGEQRHSLLSTHAFFGALGVAPPERTSVPSSVLAEATAFAEARWRKRLQEAEAAAASAMAVDGPAASGGVEAPADGAAGPSGATAAGGSSAAGPSDSGAAAAPACGALVPSSAFINAITRETKMHRGQIRVVWEALLWSQPGALQRARVKAALEDLISRRLESQHFSSVGRAAAAKRIVECPTVGKDGKTQPAAKPSTEDGEGSEGELLVTNFFMYRPTARESAAGAAGGSDGGAVDTGAVATGRLNLTQVTAEDKTSRMEELMAERRQQLSSLAAILNKGVAGATTVKPKPTQIRSLPAISGAEGGVTTVGFGAPSAGVAAADGTAAAPVPAGERKRKGPADMAAMMKALEGRM